MTQLAFMSNKANTKHLLKFLETGLAKISTHSTTWQFKTIKLIQRPSKSLYLTPGSKLMVPWSIPTAPNLKWRKATQILEHLFSKLISRSFKPVSFQSRNFQVEWAAAKECLVKAYITTYIVSKTLLFSRFDKQLDSAWNRQQTEWNVVHKLSLSYLYKSAYGSMPLEPAETRPRSNFPESRDAFPRYNQLS